MLARSLRNICLVSISLLIMSLICLHFSERNIRQSLRGNLLFADTEGNIPLYDQIEISSKDKKITLQKDEIFWRVPEADNYYAHFAKLQTLQESISSAKVGAKIKPATQVSDWTTVTLFDQGKKVGAAEIGDAANPERHYIRYPGQDNIYLSSWQAQLPMSLNSWTVQPLLRIKQVEIKKIETDNRTISRREEGAAFYNSQTHLPYTRLESTRLFTVLADLHYEQVLSSQEFDEPRYTSVHRLRLTSFEGLITTLSVHTDFEKYWLKVELSATSLPSTETNEYIAKNKILYDDWWFELSPEAGNILYSFNL